MHKTADIKTAQTGREPGAIRGFLLGVALGVAMVYCALMAASGMSSDLAARVAELNAGLIPALNAATGPGDVKVVVLGNSRVRYGFAHGFDPAEPVKLPDGRTMHVLQFSEDVALFEQYQSLWPYIIMAKPDLIVFTDMLVSTQRRAAKVSVTNISDVIFSAATRIAGKRTPEEEWDAARRNINDNCPEVLKSTHVQDRLIFTAHRDNHALENNPNADAARAALRQAQMAGIPVAMLRFPSNAPAYEPYGVPRHLIDFYGLGYVPTAEQFLPEQYKDVAWLEYPRPAPDNYCDFVHFNPKGRDAFTAWLLARIAEQVPR
jgi:hypothetical protein